VLSGVESDTTSVVASTAASEPLIRLCEGEDDGMQHFLAFLQFRVLPAETGKFVIGVGTRPHAGLLAGGRWRHALFDLASEFVTREERRGDRRRQQGNRGPCHRPGRTS